MSEQLLGMLTGLAVVLLFIGLSGLKTELKFKEDIPKWCNYATCTSTILFIILGVDYLIKLYE